MSNLPPDNPAPANPTNPTKPSSPDERPSVWLSIIIPAYNEAQRILPTLKEIDAYLAQFEDQTIEIIVVDDGSKDTTPDVARHFKPTSKNVSIRLFVNAGNSGKGYSVKRGMLEAKGEILLMVDADNSTPIQEFDKLLPWLPEGFDIAIGSRDMPDSILDPPQAWWRKIGGGAFRRFRRLMLLPDIKDTQCGFKCFSRKAGIQIFTQVMVSGFAFDCEVLALAEQLDYKVKEVGIYWKNNTDSRVQPIRDFIRALRSLAQIRKRMKRFN